MKVAQTPGLLLLGGLWVLPEGEPIEGKVMAHFAQLWAGNRGLPGVADAS
ncbi:MAG: hypothetical protein JW730_18430 [Anaerolineales bacterium]|nr:hypothetical protein [Anaerolineales bacterium]